MALVLFLSPAALAQNSLRTYLSNNQLEQDGVLVNLSPHVEITLPDRTGTLFGSQNVNIEMLDFNAHVAYIVVDGRTYYRNDFNGALRSMFDAIEINSLSMWITLNDVEDCPRHSFAAWGLQDTVSRFCQVTANRVPSVRAWGVSSASMSGVRALADEIEKRVAESSAEPQSTRSSSSSSSRTTPTNSTSSNTSSSQEMTSQQQALGQARAQYWAAQCQRADVAWRDGRRQEAATLYREIMADNSAYIAPQCRGEARSRMSDQNLNDFAYGTTSLLGAISQAFDIMTGISIGYYPDDDEDTSSGIGFGVTFGKNIFFFDAQLGDGTLGPLFAATQEPNIPGCSGPFGTNGFGTSCATLYDNWYRSTGEIRWRVNYAVGGGIVSPAGMEFGNRSYLFPAANVMYLDTERGAEIVPGFGVIWGSKKWANGRRVFSGEGMRVLFTQYRGQAGIQVAGQFTF